jgi:hypothetical protein
VRAGLGLEGWARARGLG